MNKSHVLLFTTALLATSVLLTGCDNTEKERKQKCSSAIIDFQQATVQGDKRIDVSAASKIIKEYGCTYKDVLPEDKKKRMEELKENPIPHEQLKQNGKDWSRP